MTIETDVIDIIKTILKHQGSPDAELQLSTQLYDEGVGLDSIGATELSMMLEESYGKDPYTEGLEPQTVGDIVDFYTAS